MSSIK